eukprot:sb/3470248/
MLSVTGSLALWRVFNDAIKEGDGDRQEICLKFFLPLLYQQNSLKYTNVILKVLVDRKVAMSAQTGHFLKWNSTVGFRTGKGYRMSMDDANEMLNGKIKKHARGTSFAAMKKSLDTLSLNVTAKHVFEEQGKIHYKPNLPGSAYRSRAPRDLFKKKIRSEQNKAQHNNHKNGTELSLKITRLIKEPVLELLAFYVSCSLLFILSLTLISP